MHLCICIIHSVYISLTIRQANKIDMLFLPGNSVVVYSEESLEKIELPQEFVSDASKLELESLDEIRKT